MASLNPHPHVELSVFGQKIVLRYDGENPELIRKAVELVVSKVGEAEIRAGGAAPHHVALLALMDLAAEYLQAKERTEDFKRQIDSRSARLLSWIESELK